MNSRPDAGADQPAGLAWLPRPLTESELTAAPVLASADDLLIDDLSPAEDDAFGAALAGPLDAPSPTSPARSAHRA